MHLDFDPSITNARGFYFGDPTHDCIVHIKSNKENRSSSSSHPDSIQKSNREATIYQKSGTQEPILTTNGRKGSTSSIGSGPSFTQRLIERGVAVPSSFSNWDKIKSAEDGSPGSFDFDSYYGMSPFITPSFTTATESSQFHHQEGPLYQSLRHRYEKEKRSRGKTVAATATGSEDEEETMSSPELFNTLHNNHHSSSTSSHNTSSSNQAAKMMAQRTEDSDIELSDEEVVMEPTQQQQQRLSLLPLHHTRSRRSRSPLSFPPAAQDKKGIFDLMNPTNYSGMYSPSNSNKDNEDDDDDDDDDSRQEPKPLSSDVQKLKNILITAPVAAPAKPLPNPPRHHLLHTPVFQVVNANTIKDRYLFLFSDLLLICKPILDENIIVSGSKKENRYRFRANENSLFQVKNIVELGKLTLYLSKEEAEPRSSVTSVELDAEGRPIIPPARKMHPIMASALRRFETNAADGIAYLVDKNVLTRDPLSIANFLFKTPDLNRRQLGYYLSDLNHGDVYEAFLECFRLVGLRLDEALRILLTTFRLPSNWEALEYLIERFAKKWHDANQNVIKFHEDMVVKVVVAMLFLNAEIWYDATSEKDVFWYARQLKERQDRQSKRKMSVIDYHHRAMTMPAIVTKPSSSATTSSRNNRESVTVEPLHYIMSMRANGNGQPTLDEFLDRWNYYDQYRLVPKEFMEEMYKSIQAERLETGWDNKTGKQIPNEGGVERPKVVSPSVQQGSQDVVITVIPHRLPTRLTKGVPSDPITISIPEADKGLQIKLRGQDLVFEPNILDFSHSPIQTFTITGNTLGRTSLMFIKSGENAGNYVSPTLPRTKSVVVERPFMRFTFQIGFKHVDFKGELDGVRKDEPVAGTDGKNHHRESMINRKYTFSVETEQERHEWINALKKLSGHVNEETNEKSTSELNNMSAEARVALQVLKEVLLADEVKKGTARAKTPIDSTYSERHGRAMKLLLPKKSDEDRSAGLMAGTTNVVTKRGHEIVKLVVQNSMVPLVLGFLRHQIS
ncbi:hypothetical protein K501DRAFT_333571 [Backusella circina FSU 941]|nr:hypothetical protein K501DRAFT_333571 [Backusella circina FSU 941]